MCKKYRFPVLDLIIKKSISSKIYWAQQLRIIIFAFLNYNKHNFGKNSE